MDRATRPPTWQVLLAFGIVYFVWGSTFLAIRVGVREVPPFLLAAMRFLLAGIALYVVDADARHGFTAWPRVAFRVAAGGADIRGRLWTGLLGGNARAVGRHCRHVGDHSGVHGAVGNLFPGNATSDPAAGLRAAGGNWRSRGAGEPLVGTGRERHRSVRRNCAVDCRDELVGRFGAHPQAAAACFQAHELRRPDVLRRSIAGVDVGGAGRVSRISSAGGFACGMDPLAYLTVAGSIVAFTAYVWLIHHESPTRVGTYAYVNPVIAVALGYLFAGEAVGARTLLGTMLVLVSVIVITAMPARKSTPARLEEVLPVGEASEG